MHDVLDDMVRIGARAAGCGNTTKAISPTQIATEADPVRKPDTLPLPALRSRGEPPTTSWIALTTCDRNGRLAERSTVRTLGWTPGQRFDLSIVADMILVRATLEGMYSLSKDGFLRIPAPIRRYCELSAGDRVLLAAIVERGIIVISATRIIDEALRPSLESVT